MATSDDTTATPPPPIQLSDEVDFSYAEEQTRDLFFSKIGASLPLNNNSYDHNGGFGLDLEGGGLTRPLVVSERFKAVFVVHSEGIYVARMKEVIELAKAVKDEEKSGGCIADICVVDVPVKRVKILAVSADSSYLSVCVGSRISFFSVESLLNKGKRPFFTCLIEESSDVKDFIWRKKVEDSSYVILSKSGKLYKGNVDCAPKEVMDNVDAVDWSINGKYVAVVRENTLSIMSSKFKERISMSLLFKSWVSDTDSVPKVDSVNWIRRDCIIIGCFGLTEGVEEDYLVQIITVREGKITEASSKPVVLSMKEVFTCIVDDSVPYGGGPYMFLNYLEHWDIAVAAHRKNSDAHIVLLGWSADTKEEDAAIILSNQPETWWPRIELQENDDDNFITGFAVDKVSLYDKLTVPEGEETKDISPYCVLMCLTSEGKLIMFYTGSGTEYPAPCQIESALSDEEDSIYVVTSESDHSKSPLKLDEHRKNATFLDTTPGETIHKEPEAKGAGYLLKRGDSVDSEVKNTVSASFTNSSPSNPLFTSNISISKDPRAGTLSTSDKATAKFQDFNQRNPEVKEVGGLSHESESSNTRVGNAVSFPQSESSLSNPQSIFNLKDTRASAPSLFQSSDKSSPFGRQIDPSGSAKIVEPVSSIGNSPIFSHKAPTFGTSVNPNSQISSLKTPSFGTNQNSQISSHKAPSFGTNFNQKSQIPSQNVSTYGTSFNQNVQKMPEKSKTFQFSGAMGSEPDFSRHVGNVSEMAKELDTLLSNIEGEGGFRDACIVSLKDSVATLEERLDNISDRCRALKHTVVTCLEDTQILLDKTVQVAVKKIYMESIVKQASDSQYWDIWNRQKLNPELELKRRQILKVNQDLTNQLIELERHFNTIELNKFGKQNGTAIDRKKSNSCIVSSSYNQSLNSLYNTMNSQLAAAEKLSECLSKQMDLLQIEPQPVKRQTVAKELFDSIGLSYSGDSYSSPDMKKAVYTPDTTNKFLLRSRISLEETRRNSSSAMKSVEPETARRRRDSLDRSWASYDPPKTTVKRILLQEERQMDNAVKSPTYKSRGVSSSHSIPRLRLHTTPSGYGIPLVNKHQPVFQNQDLQGQPSEQSSLSKSFNLSERSLKPSETVVLNSSVTQVAQRSAIQNSLSPLVANPSAHSPNQSILSETSGSSSNKSITGGRQAEKRDLFGYNSHSISETKISVPVEASPTQRLSTSGSVPAQDLRQPETQSVIDKVDSSKDQACRMPSIKFNFPSASPKPQPTSTSVLPKPSTSPEKPPNQDIATNISPTISKLPSQLSTSLRPSIDFNKTGLLASSSSEPVSSLVPSVPSSALSFQVPKENVLPSMPLALLSVVSSTPEASHSQPKVPIDELGQKVEDSVIPEPAVKASISEPEPPTQEDDMDEEAPDATTELNLGNLGNFGLGSVSTQSTPKTNPFGNLTSSAPANSATIPFNLSAPSGQMFRPASFSFPLAQTPQPTNTGLFSTGFNPVAPAVQPGGGGFGQPSQLGPGQQVLGSVLGGFGQTRQLGAGLPGTGFATPNSFPSPPSGGFAGAASGVGGFAGAASGVGGFAGAASGGGFGGGGFAGAAPAGGGFGAFGNKGGGGFSSFGGTAGTGNTNSAFTQIRK